MFAAGRFHAPYCHSVAHGDGVRLTATNKSPTECILSSTRASPDTRSSAKLLRFLPQKGGGSSATALAAGGTGATAILARGVAWATS